MDERDEAQPRQRRNRRALYPKRVELRMTQSSFDLASEAALRASEATGRTVSISHVIRAAVDDGCRALLRGVQHAQPNEGGVTREQVDALGEIVEEAGHQIRRVGVNVDQIAAKANATGVVVDSLAEVKEELRLIRAEMASAFGQVLGVDDEEDDEDG